MRYCQISDKRVSQKCLAFQSCFFFFFFPLECWLVVHFDLKKKKKEKNPHLDFTRRHRLETDVEPRQLPVLSTFPINAAQYLFSVYLKLSM